MTVQMSAIVCKCKNVTFATYFKKALILPPHLFSIRTFLWLRPCQGWDEIEAGEP